MKYYGGFPDDSVVKNLPVNTGEVFSILGREDTRQ